MSTRTSGYSLRNRSRGNVNNGNDAAAGGRTALVSEIKISTGNAVETPPFFGSAFLQ